MTTRSDFNQLMLDAYNAETAYPTYTNVTCEGSDGSGGTCDAVLPAPNLATKDKITGIALYECLVTCPTCNHKSNVIVE